MAGIDLELRFSDLLVVSNLSLQGVNTAAYAWDLAQALRVAVDIVHVETSNRALDPDRCERLAAAFSDLQLINPASVDGRWCLPQYHQERIVAAEDIIRKAEGFSSGLIVSGVHPASRINRHLHASFAFELAARASCPLLSMPSNE